MTPETQKQIASRGGKSAHAKGKAHRFTREEAQQAGAKGGKIAAERRRRGSSEKPPIVGA